MNPAKKALNLNPDTDLHIIDTDRTFFKLLKV